MRTPIRIVLMVLLVVVASCDASDDGSAGAASELVLAPDGIGRYTVGQPADEVIAGMSANIGGPDADSMDDNTPLQVTDCGSTQTRLVSWGNLVLFFVDRDGTSVFATWSYGFDPVTGNAEDVRRLGLTTEAGIGLGSSRTELVSAYGSTVTFSQDAQLDLETFAIDQAAEEHLSGRLTSLDPDAMVQLLERQPGCVAPSQ